MAIFKGEISKVPNFSQRSKEFLTQLIGG